MMKMILLEWASVLKPSPSLLTLTWAVFAVGCGDSVAPTHGLPRELSVAEARLIDADNKFTFKLFRQLDGRADPHSNIFVSPFSVAMALGMAYNGAAGATRAAMQQALELQGMSVREVNESYRSLIDLLQNLDPQVEWVVANAIWHRDSFTPMQSFLDVTRTYYDAEISGLNFASPDAPSVINRWVSDKTHGTITEIVPPSMPETLVMYLVNAIYFKGGWTYQFDTGLTEPGLFTLADGTEVSVQMMSHSSEATVGVFFGDHADVIDLPYGATAYRMTIVVPHSPNGLTALVGGLDRQDWDAWIAGLDTGGYAVTMPKFTFSYGVELTEVLRALGLTQAFDCIEADFTNIHPDGRLCITDVQHKTFVDVNEEGTEAAAVTSIPIGPDRRRLRSLVVDSPFLFAIRERFSGAILFLGRIVNPPA